MAAMGRICLISFAGCVSGVLRLPGWWLSRDTFLDMVAAIAGVFGLATPDQDIGPEFLRRCVHRWITQVILVPRIPATKGL
jgi:hypothetical protein